MTVVHGARTVDGAVDTGDAAPAPGPEPTPTAGPDAPAPRRRRTASALAVADGTGSRRTSAAWLALALTAVLAAGLVVLVFWHKYYFVEDTEKGAYGIWYKLGLDLRAGHIQVLNPQAWMAGNYVAEGQWGFWNPVILLVGLLASYSSNAVVFSTVLKLVLLLVGSSGVFVLTRGFGVRAPWAAVAAVAVPLGGFTMYMDMPSWVTGLMIWSVLPWLWHSVRRMVSRPASPFWPLLLTYLDVTVGYVYGAIAVAFVLLAVAVPRLVDRDVKQFLRLAGVGVFAILLMVTVYLPGIATTDVTQRQTGVLNDGFLSVDLTDLVAGVFPTARPEMLGWWGEFVIYPVAYLSWFLPFIAFVDWGAARQRCRHLLDAGVLLALFGVLVFGPSQIGPLRYPARTLPVFGTVLLVVLVVLLSRARARRSRGRLLAVLALYGVAAYVAYGQYPQTARSLLAYGAVSAVVAAVVWWLSPAAATPDDPDTADRADTADRDDERRGAGAQRGLAVTAIVMIAVSLGFTVLQHRTYPVGGPEVPGMPAEVSAYKAPASAVVNDGIVVGTADTGDAAFWRETLLGNSWYVNGKDIQNVYTPVGFGTYAPVVCMDNQGNTCPELLDRLFVVRPATGLQLADELSLDSVLIIKRSVPDGAWDNPPSGWRLADDGDLTATWVREQPVGTAGGPVTESAGVAVTPLRNTDTTVAFRVDRVPAGGGTVTLSRLAWPGYSAQGASIAAVPADQFLLQVDVPASAAGQEVVVRFTPPHWKAVWASWALALAGGLLWCLAAAVTTRRRRRAGAVRP